MHRVRNTGTLFPGMRLNWKEQCRLCYNNLKLTRVTEEKDVEKETMFVWVHISALLLYDALACKVGGCTLIRKQRTPHRWAKQLYSPALPCFETVFLFYPMAQLIRAEQSKKKKPGETEGNKNLCPLLFILKLDLYPHPVVQTQDGIKATSCGYSLSKPHAWG